MIIVDDIIFVSLSYLLSSIASMEQCVQMFMKMSGILYFNNK